MTDAPEAVPARHAGFLSLLPRLHAHGNAYFRHIACSQRRDDLVAEAVAIAWKWYALLVQRGRDPHSFAATLVHRSLLQARSYRRLCGQEKSKDALSPLAQRRHGFRAAPCIADEQHGQRGTHMAQPEDIGLRLDLAAWLEGLPQRKKKVALALLSGEKPGDLADMMCLSPARISQIRADLRDGWRRFRSEQD